MNNNNTTRRDTMHCVSTAPTFLAIIFALAFTFSCSSDDGDDDTTGGTSSGLEESSSSSEKPESSSSSENSLSSSSSEETESSSSAELSSSSEGFAGSYEDVAIGNQVWIKKNLYAVPTGVNNSATNSWCYYNEDNNPFNFTPQEIETICEIYGRLYDWATAMALPENCNEEECRNRIDTPYHQGICPNGYHIPTNADWNKLYHFVDGTSVGANYNNDYNSPAAGKYLKDKSGSWIDCGTTNTEFECLDTYGFSALAGGYRNSDGNFLESGNYGYWWSADEYDSEYAHGSLMGYEFDDALRGKEGKSIGFSVRCVKD